MSTSGITLGLTHSFAEACAGCYLPAQPAHVPQPRGLIFNRGLAQALGLDADALFTEQGAELLAGNVLPTDAQPLAQAYAGHQFGNFAPQLGDGRALLLGEVVDPKGQRWDVQLKGSGQTSFSRRGDGKAAVGPMLREYLLGEAMFHLGVPTTRALAVVATGEAVRRERALPGAVLTRIAASHLRVGTFEYFAARQDTARVRQLADYSMRRHYPELNAGDYADFLRAVCVRQARLVARWMAIGFIHGVMNTDNMTISGETIDYGPCAFIEHYHPKAVFSSIDELGRYAYGRQPNIARWNLTRLAEALLPLLDTDETRAVDIASRIIADFQTQYQSAWCDEMRRKLGLRDEVKADEALAQDFLALMETAQADFTLSWRYLIDAAAGDETRLRSLFPAPTQTELSHWLTRWRQRLGDAPDLVAMRRANPYLIPRNHQVEAALTAASDHNDLAPFRSLLAALSQPFDEHHQAYATPAPRDYTAQYCTYCGT
ncbi:MAG: YdiU family protein [Gallionella sp.]|nr:YdiU family protein [Gallionella sp.]